MKAWLRWSLWQLYLIFFWPSRFQREVEGDEPGQPRLSLRERAVYLLKMSPWTVLARSWLTWSWVCVWKRSACPMSGGVITNSGVPPRRDHRRGIRHDDRRDVGWR